MGRGWHTHSLFSLPAVGRCYSLLAEAREGREKTMKTLPVLAIHDSMIHPSINAGKPPRIGSDSAPIVAESPME